MCAYSECLVIHLVREFARKSKLRSFSQPQFLHSPHQQHSNQMNGKSYWHKELQKRRVKCLSHDHTMPTDGDEKEEADNLDNSPSFR